MSDVLIPALATLIALALQYAALAGVPHAPAALDPFLAFCVLQAVAGCVEAWAIRLLLPASYQQPARPTLLLLWLLCTLVPLAGGLIALVSCAWAYWFPAARANDQLTDVARPQFVTHLVSRVSHGSGARLQARLANTQVSTTDRLSALVAIQNMPTRTTGSLLRGLLTDPVEDIRLIAYGTLDQAENEIMQKIFDNTKALESAATDDERHALHCRLAELHFELVYQNLVQSAVFQHTLEEAERHAAIALSLASSDKDAALWLIRGRLALASSQPDAAAAHLAEAQRLGFPRERLLPWLAEAAFLKGDYARTRELLASLGSAAALPVLKPVVEYWSS
jgi:polysaccharide biosynthesis protein PelE